MVKKLYDTLHLIWKTYHFSAKSRRELNRLGTELGANIRVASSVKGTRWVPHVQRALEVFLTGIPKDRDLSRDAGQFAATFFHVENLGETSKNADIKGRAKKVNTYYCHLFNLSSCNCRYSHTQIHCLVSFDTYCQTLHFSFTCVAACEDHEEIRFCRFLPLHC